MNWQPLSVGAQLLMVAWVPVYENRKRSPSNIWLFVFAAAL